MLAAIYAAPADDAPRLVYADYLMARGDARGEVIAMQCHQRGLPRAHALLAKHRRKWLGPLAAAIDTSRAYTFERGFVATAVLSASAPAELDDHPAWATLRRVVLPKQRRALAAHLARLGCEPVFPRPVPRSSSVVDDLEYAATGGPNRFWRGERGIGRLRPGVDAGLVDRALRILLPWSAVICLTLPDDYAPLAWRLLAEVKTPEATFLRAYLGHDPGARLRDACTWLYEFRKVDDERRNRHRLPELAGNPEAVIAALACVRAHGIAAERLLAIPAYVGGDDALAAVRRTVDRALASRGADLDKLEEWFAPFVRGPAMTALAAKVAEAKARRGEDSPLLGLLARFGAPGERLDLTFSVAAKQVRIGLTRKASAYIQLHSHAVPSASASFTWDTMNFSMTRWRDGVLDSDKAEVGGPKSVDDLPRWLAAAAKKRKITWDPTTVRVHGSLRGRARAAAVAWLLGGSVSAGRTAARP